jgi:hypothetical protein
MSIKFETALPTYRLGPNYTPEYCRTVGSQNAFVVKNEPKSKVAAVIQNRELLLVPGKPQVPGKPHIFYVYSGNPPSASLDYVMECVTVGVSPNRHLPKEINSRAAFQASVWRSKALLVSTSNFVADVFWKYLFSQNRNVIADSHQSDKGEGFWLTRFSEANDRGYKTYGLDCELVNGVLFISSADLITTAKDFDTYYTEGQDLSGYYKRIAFCK